ncbi:unnamed protein product, partial [Brenthis ino]
MPSLAGSGAHCTHRPEQTNCKKYFDSWPPRGGATCGPVYNRGRALCAAPRIPLSLPDGLLTFDRDKHDVEQSFDPDPFASDDCLDDFSPDHPFLLTPIEELNTMSTGEDEPSSGLNGRLRPRKSNIPSPQSAKITRKLDTKPNDKPKRITPSKVTPTKPDDLTNKSDSPSPQILCPYCDKIFYAKQAVSKHIRRTHLSSSKQDNSINCLFCNHNEGDGNDIIRHMVDNHPNQYFACYDCHTRFPSTTELAEHKLNVCEKQKLPYRNKLRQKTPKKGQKAQNANGRNDFGNDDKNFTAEHGFNRIVISCELKPSHPNDPADIEDNITTNLILPPSKTSGNATVIEKNAVILLDDLQWNKRVPPNFSFHNTDADQILSRLGVVHRSPRAGESNRREWFKNMDESNQKFEKCFDTSFYSKVASNVQENLTKFLDGTFNFNPDPENTIKTRKAKNSVPINTVEGFPILLTCEQFNRNIFDAYMPRAIAPKHKWKWDSLENDKSLMSPEQLKRDSHTNNCIITLVSSLDIWTQLCMRRKFEKKFSLPSIEKKTEKQNIIGKELKEILESRELPTSFSQVVKYTEPQVPARESLDFPSSLGLVPNKPSYDLKPAVLSGEWVRPRCYVCCACGAQTRDSKALSSHISNHHPNAQIQHYEIVGEVLLNSDILKHLYVPPSQMNNRTRPLRGFRECTKCKKSITLEDLHQHMLDCAGDTPTVRRKCRYRPFGMRKRRPRLPDNTIRKKIRKDIRSRHTRKNHMRPRQKIRSEVGDAETIRKMLADLPAKRHRVMVNPLNPILRPRRKLNKQRNKLVMKKRMIDEVKKKTQNNDSSLVSNNVSDDPKRGFLDQSDHKINKTSVKRVASKILRHKDSFNKKTSINRSRRKGVPTKELGTVAGSNTPSDGEGNMQNQQSSMENNSDRININDGSYNKREQSNNNNGSNNNGNQQPGSSGQNNSSENSSNPSQNVPLKHSIERLTACPDTQDKSVQFHYAFLVQQECNGTGQHMTHNTSEERMLFENEAIVTKLDKPPLHFGHQEIMDTQMFNKSKLNKRKGLNDCIAMLKNKLVEPNIGTPPGRVSVQCGTDEPLDPEPVVIERRHSTTDSKFDTAQRSLQMHYPNKTLQDTLQNYDMGSRVTRRSCNVRQEQALKDMQANNDYIQGKLLHDNQLYAVQKNNEQYTRREPIRRRSVVLPEDLLLQHSMNVDILTGKNFRGFPEYSYPNNIKSITPPRPPTRRSRDARSRSRSKVTKEKPSRDASLVSTPRTRRNSRRKIESTTTSATPTPTRRLSEKQIEHTNVGGSLITTENVALGYPRITMTDDRISVIENQILPTHNFPDEQAYHNARVYQNPPTIQYPNEADIRPLHYNMHIEPTITAPLDLSSKLSRSEGQKAIVQYVTEPQYCAVPYDNYETLDLSNRHSVQLHEKVPQINTDDVVDLRVKYTSHPTHLPCFTPVPADIVSNRVEDNIADLSIRQSCITQDDYYPTDLSVKRSYPTVHLYEKHGIQDNGSDINMIQDLSRPMMQVQHMCTSIVGSLQLVNEQPTDLSSRRNENSSNPLTICMTERQPINLNICTNTTDLRNEDIPADLSARNKERRHRIYVDSQGTEFYEEIVVNNETGSIHNANDAHLSINCMDAEQTIHYNSSPRINCSRSTIMTYSEHSNTIDDTQNISTSNLISPTAATCNVATCNEIVYRHSEVPLSLTINKIPEPRAGQRDTVTNPIVYEPSQANYIMTNSAQYNTGGNLNTNSAQNTSTALTITVENRESVNTIQSSTSPISQKTCNDDVIIQNEEVITDSKKYVPIRKSPVPSTIHKLESDKKSTESVQAEVNKTTLDQDPETARKIAMLPKELVEILGTMPIDHRNQLLNVLPQYVSTSTSSVLPNNKANSKSSSCNSPNVKSSIQINDDLEKDHKTDITSDDGRPLITNTMAMSPTTVSSSILLTPPTPQLPERHMIQSQENADLISSKYRTNSRRSADGQIPVRNIDTDKSKAVSNLSLSIKNIVKMDEIDTKDRIIDLTVDEFSPEDSEVYYNPDPSNHTIPIPNSMKPNAQKSNNDKTASLRAVRIKAPSERQRSILSENTSFKKHTDNVPNISEEKQKPRTSETSNPMAIQQAEISSTQHRTVAGLSPISPTLDPSPKENNSTRNVQENIEKDTLAKSDNDIRYSMTEKQNIVTSSLTKDVDNNLKNSKVLAKVNTPKVSTEIVNVSSSKKNDTETEFCTESSSISTQSAIDASQSKTKAILETSNDKSTIEDEDSEDDVTLATIVKKKNRECNVTVEINNIQLERKKKKTKKTKKAEQINDAHVLQQNQNDIVTEDDKPSVAETDLSIDSSEGSTKNKDFEVTDDTNEKITILKKKSKKGRRTNNFGATKYIERQDQIYQTIAEKEVDKENTVSSDIVNSKETIEEPVKEKCTSDSDSNRSIVTNKNLIRDKEMSAKKEKVKKSIEFSSDCNSTKNLVIDKKSEKSTVPDKNEHETSLSLASNISCNASNTPCNSDAVTNEAIADKELKIRNNVEKLELNEDSNMTKNLKVNLPKIQDDLNKSEDPLPSQKNIMKDKNDEELTENPLEKPKINDREDSNTTPLRRSRRGKSLFIDSTSIMNENVVNSENTTEHKAPLTKKQLIFSKLLLDEENHNKNSKTSSQDKQLKNTLPDTYNKALTSDSEVERETFHEDKKGNKRKKSPQLKRKCKRKKSLIILQAPEDTDVESVNVPTSEKSPNLATENIVSTSHTTSYQKHDFLDKKSVEIDKTFVNRDPRLEASLLIQKASSTEKRKSSSPVTFDLVPSFKPKKSKPNDEVSSTQSTTLEKAAESEMKSVNIKQGATAIVVSRSTPCYNKPAARRARSKSVVVKSSGADLYDPYDIDLEDMVEKTEPFVRKETSKIEFKSFKSSFVSKAKKLTKTAPSAIIDILPSNLADIALSTVDASIEKDNSITETGQPTSGFVNTSVGSTKDSSSDSDESSKSDVPLKKYVEEKERKLLEEVNKTKRQQESKDSTVENEKSDKLCDKSKSRKKITRAQSINNKEETASLKQDTEEELRSEQFMESFGFFSERKPRKSNLLATKKISETFHIIANESDDVYFSSKDKVCKKTNDSKKEEDTKGPISPIKKAAKRGRKKKSLPPEPSFCHICKKAFRRSDNYLRHQMTLIHISRLSEVELKFKTVKIEEEPNYLIAYKQQLDRLKVLQNKIAKRKKNCLSTADIILPTLEEILADVKRTIREQQLSRRGLSRDQALFIDCCTMLKESHTNDQAPVNKRIRNCNSFNCAQTCQEELALLERSISDDRCDIKCDDVDSITAKNILESEEVRNLEKDLISNLKEANGLKGPLSNVHFKSSEEYTSVDEEAVNYNDESQKTKSKRQIEVKDKMYPDVVENIDMFEDKFDKIKRKCRSQAAAAKQIQSRVESNISHKNLKKIEKKKGKRRSKKCHSTVPTKGALKGFDGFKVSILTSDINMSAIVSSVGNSFKKKKKTSSKRKRERKSSDVSSKCDSDHRSKDTPQKKVDVYEFMDTEDTELFEFRPSTLMERFKSISNKEIPSTSKAVVNQDDLAEASSESGSDGDDFVYMSDDYVCSDDETENSMLSCELGHKKTVSPLKRKDAIEKNAVMGKIFKHNAVRSERRSPKRRETPKPKANLDQLFDSLLQEEPKTSLPAKNNDALPKNKDAVPLQTYNTPASPKPDTIKSKYDSPSSASHNSKQETKNILEKSALPDSSNYPSTSSSSKKRKSITPPRKLDLNLISTTIEYAVLDSNRKDVKKSETGNERRHSSLHSDMATKYDIDLSDDEDDYFSADEDVNASPQSDHYQKHKSREKTHKEKEKPYANKKEIEKPEVAERSEPTDQTSDDAGVARQRARRKCTVGKQNVLAETWSSESEPDGAPQRANSAESVIGGGRKKRSRKKDMSCSRKASRQPKRPETERVARPRAAYYWSEGEDEQEHPQQHGWIVGDSHKKLVTMLAHAKGRKRHDDKRQVLE